MNNKKQIRSNFRKEVFERDQYKCICCGLQSSVENCKEEIDAHHISNRNDFKNGGYLKLPHRKGRGFLAPFL